MTNNEICNAAISLSGEVLPAGSTDYVARAPYLLALIYTECAPLDDLYRAAHGMDANGWTPCVSVEPKDTFPLSEIFSAPASYALAAMLTIDENAELSEAMYKRFASLLEAIRSGIPAVAVPITDRYGLR